MTQQTIRRRLSAPARRERIEQAAVGTFAARGYDAASIGEIAAAAGVSRTVLYDHFPSKRALYLHVLSAENDEMLAAVGRGITGAGPGRNRMKATIAAYLDYSRSRPAARQLLIDPIPSGDRELDQVMRAMQSSRSQTVATLLAADLERSGVPEASSAAPIVVELLIAGIDGVARWWADRPEMRLDDVTDAAFRLLWNGLPRFSEG
ncbi:MAG: TetR/AcrR family transcriptional regulator [Aeromicrobium sp.]